MNSNDEFTTGPIPPAADDMQEQIDVRMAGLARWLETRGIAEDETVHVFIVEGNRIRCKVSRTAKTGEL